MRVVVIGGTKFIGRRIVEELLARGDAEPVAKKPAERAEKRPSADEPEKRA